MDIGVEWSLFNVVAVVWEWNEELSIVESEFLRFDFLFRGLDGGFS